MTSEPAGKTDEQELSMYCPYYLDFISFALSFLEWLKSTWRSLVYSFFKSKVNIKYDDGHKFHFFWCSAKKCKGSGGIQQYQDSKDCVATSNLKSHTMKCFGINAVNAAANKTKPNCHDGSIFALFACPGQQPVMISHQSCTNGKMRYVFLYFFYWCLTAFAKGSHPKVVCWK